jgi:phosphomannomutase/phosphoglucomutase
MASKGGILSRSPLVLYALVVLVFAVFVALGFLLQQQGDGLRERRIAELAAQQRSAALTAQLQAMQAELEALAGTDVVRSALDDPDNGLTWLARAFVGGVDAVGTALGPLGTAAPDFPRARFLNNIEVDLVARAFEGRDLDIEGVQYEGRRLLVMAAPVPGPAGEQPPGVVLLRLDAPRTLAALIGDEAGSIAIRSSGRDFFQHGAPSTDLQSEERALAGSTLSLRYSPSADQLAAEPRVSAIPLLIAAAAAGLVLLIVMLLVFTRLRSRLRADVQVLVALAGQRKTTANLPQLAYPELGAVGETMRDLLRRSETGTGTANETAQPAAPEPGLDELGLDPLQAGLGDGEGLELDEDPLQLDEAVEAPAVLFRAYDVRGKASAFSDPLLQALGQAIGSEALREGPAAVVVGSDARDSSPRMREAIVKGLLETGCDVVDIGTVATPMAYFAAQHLETENAVMITGSHSPADINGAKIMLGGQSLAGERIQDLRRRIGERDFESGQGSYRVSDINGDYVAAIADDIVLSGDPTVVIDCGNGAAGVIATELFEALGARVITLFEDLDGSFPNHAPDPSDPVNMQQLSGAVIEHGASIGIAFDGDADRLGVVDGQGRVVAADRLLMLFARDLLSRHPGADVVFDVKCSRHLARVISEAGGRPVMWRSGHSWIKQKMAESGALLGGEFTGHICFRERWFGFDDALYAAARLLEIMGLEDRTLEDLLAELPASVATPELFLPVPEEDKFALMERLAAQISFPDAKLITIDGVRAEFEDGWGLLRPSNTGPALSLRFEADDADALARIQQTFREQLDGMVDTSPLQ